MNIHLICKRYYTNKDLSGDRFGRLYHLPTQLRSLGANVSVSAIDYRNRLETESNQQGVLFRTFPVSPIKILQCLRQVYAAARSAEPDIIIASGDIYLGLLGLQIAHRLRARFVYDIYDYYPAFKINRYPGSTALFNYTVGKADLALCASQPLLNTVIADLNKNAILIENGVDRELFKAMDTKLVRQALDISVDLPLVGYFGSITPTRGPILVEACRIVRESLPSLRLLLAGRITDVCINEPWIDYLGELKQAAVPELINACDVVCIPYAGDAFNRMSGACKIAEYLACGRPVVATRISDHQNIFQDAESTLCDPEPVDMARKIWSQLRQPQVAPCPDTLEWQAISRVLYRALANIV